MRSLQAARRSLLVAPALFAIACGGGQEAGFPFAEQLGGAAAGKGDMIARAHIIDDIALNSRIDGRFDDRTRVYGFTVEAKAGAVLTVKVTAQAGAKSSDVAEGEALDTILTVYGPVVGEDRGPQIALVDDDAAGGRAAQLPPIAIAQDGKYLVAMATWDDPGKGSYRIAVDCDGTDFQCRRPVQTRPCEATTRYITGGTVLGTETWSACEVVLVEQVVVDAGAVLTVSPGVKVLGNYVGTDAFGTVDLVVNGTLQAVGTAQDPVVFAPLKKGWKGIVLNGASNTLKHVFVEGARVGLEVHGTNNTFQQLNVNSGDTGIFFTATSTGNVVEGLRVTKVRDGIHLSGQVDIIDSVLLGNGADTESGSGIWGELASTRSRFHRALIANFPHGLYLNATELEVYDSTIVNNRRGVFVTGDNAGVHPSYSCPTFPQAPPPPPVRPLPPATWGRDPVFVRCDIINNSEYAVKIAAPELLVIEQSNIRGNGAGVIIESDSLHEESRVRENNIFENGTSGIQVESFHVNGTLDISGNYWAQLSDPELSASWKMSHDQAQTCVENRTPHGNCTYRSSSQYTCGAYDCRRNGNWSCTATVTASWSGEFTFTGFSPLPLPAGPELANCTDPVKQERQQQGL